MQTGIQIKTSFVFQRCVRKFENKSVYTYIVKRLTTEKFLSFYVRDLDLKDLWHFYKGSGCILTIIVEKMVVGRPRILSYSSIQSISVNIKTGMVKVVKNNLSSILIPGEDAQSKVKSRLLMSYTSPYIILQLFP